MPYRLCIDIAYSARIRRLACLTAALSKNPTTQKPNPKSKYPLLADGCNKKTSGTNAWERSGDANVSNGLSPSEFQKFRCDRRGFGTWAEPTSLNWFMSFAPAALFAPFFPRGFSKTNAVLKFNPPLIVLGECISTRAEINRIVISPSII